MSNEPNANDQPQTPPNKDEKLPPQSSPQDTSNWDNREFTTPSGRIVIETDQGSPDDIIIAD